MLLGSKRGSEGETVQASVKRKREEALVGENGFL